MKNTSLINLLLTAAALPLFAGCDVYVRPGRAVIVAPAPVVVEADPAPPPAQVEYIPPQPDPAYLWIGGTWEWRGRWVWAGGHWAARPHARAVWVPGGWVHRGHDRVWVAGHWR